MKDEPERNRMVRGTYRKPDCDQTATGWICPVCRRVNAPNVTACDHGVVSISFPSFIIIQKDNADLERKARGKK